MVDRVAFIDVSEFRGEIDFRQVANDPLDIKHVTSRLTSAGDIDLFGRRNIAGTRAAGMLAGGRHRLYAHPSVAEQFALFRREMEAVGVDGLVPSYDSEDDASWSQTLEFGQRIEDLWGCPPMAYIPCWWVRNKIAAGQIPADATLPDNWVFWHSKYNVDPFPLCLGRTSLDGQAWQYTSKGVVLGVPGNCDLNWYYGTLTQLQLHHTVGANDAERVRMLAELGL